MSEKPRESELARVLAALERLGAKRSKVMNVGQARVALIADAARLLRALQDDFIEYAEHRAGCALGGTVGGKPVGCDCGVETAREKWSLPE